MSIKLLENATGNIVGEAFHGDGADKILVCEGSFGGGSLKLQTSHNLIDWQDVASDGAVLTVGVDSNFAARVALSSLNIRAVLTGATDSDLTVKLI